LWKSRPEAREFGLGSARDISLADAREAAAAARKLKATGTDPILERDRIAAEKRAESARAITFKQCAETYIESQRAEWKNAKHMAQWPSTLGTYVYPVIGSLPVGTVQRESIESILRPIWTSKTETAKRVRQRIETVLDWATAKGYRFGDNPARWEGLLEHMFPNPTKVAPVKHHPALPYSKIPSFMARLRSKDSVSARALEFAILNAARTVAVIGATWDEIDLAAKVWTVPPLRTGSKIPEDSAARRVPLAARSIEILENLPRRKGNPHVFIGGKGNKGLSNMALLEMMRGLESKYVPHGFRSTFKDWCSEETNFPNETSEAALWHKVADKVEASYRRGDLFDKRRRLMEAWERYCAGKAQANEVVPIRAEAVAA